MQLKHRKTKRFRQLYDRLPTRVQLRADNAFALLCDNPDHPSLHFKKIGAFWSARIDDAHRALAVADDDGLTWVWIGSHDEYERLIANRRPS